MRFPTRFFLLASLFAAASCAVTGLSIAIRDDTKLTAREPKIEKVEKAEFSTDLMAPHDVEIVRRAGWTFNNNQRLLMALVVQNGTVATAACALGNPVTCTVGVVYALFSFFFTAYLLQDRSVVNDATAPYFVLPPTPDQTLVQRLRAELPIGQWHFVGHVQHGGLNHTVHYFNTGTIQRLRARNVPFWNETQGDLAARQADPDNDGGFVGDYSWLSNNEAPYDSFHSTPDSTSFFAANAGGWMIDSAQAIAACADFADGDGTLDHGLLTIGWNNQEFQWTEPGEEMAVYSECRSMLGD